MEKREQDDSYHHVLKYTGVFGGVQGLKILVTLIRNKLTALLLGEAGMGLNKRFLNIAEVLNAWTNFGIAFYSVQQLSELYEEDNESKIRHFVEVIRTWSVCSALLGFFICFFFASQLNDYYLGGEPHRAEIMLLSLFVASLPIEAVECSILKAVRRLRTIAFVEVLCVISTLLLTAPLYFLLGFKGIVLSIVLCGWSAAIIHLFFTVRLFRYRLSLFSLQTLREGVPLILIGVPYMLAGVAAAMATGEVFKFLNDDKVVGLYGVGFGLMVTYSGMIFKALETDFFPRLSSINHDVERRNHAINQQIDVCLLLVTPFMIVFALFMPFIIPLLYDTSFQPAIAMSVCAVFSPFFKAVVTPIAYTSLAKGDSWLFLIMEIIYDVVFVLAICFGYSEWGLTGTGIALSFLSLFDLLLISTVYGSFYHYRMRRRTFLLILPQALLLGATICVCFFLPTIWKVAAGAFLLLFSACFSWCFLSSQSSGFDEIKSKLFHK